MRHTGHGIGRVFIIGYGKRRSLTGNRDLDFVKSVFVIVRRRTNRDDTIVEGGQNAVFVNCGDIVVIDRPIDALIGICRKNFWQKEPAFRFRS